MKRIKLLGTIASGCLLTCPSLFITSCGRSFDQQVNDVYKNVIEEFKEFSKHPHASLYLDEIRCYLTNRLNSWGYDVMRDNYGNIWFDIPASYGYENYPKLILQAHMDMVMRGIPEEEYPYVGVDLVETTDTDGRPIMQSKDNLTSIGADDGIGVATIMAIARDASISHGPLRCVLTADEEEGLFGATALSSVVLDTDYLLNIDGEGNKTHEYIVTRGCGGLCEYWFNKKYESSTEILSNKFEIEISGFAGGHFNSEDNIIYNNDGPQLRGNADRFLLEVLNKIMDSSGLNKSVQISEFNHKATVGGEDTTFEARHLPTHARVTFATDAIASEVNSTIESIYNSFKTKYKGEDWTKIAQPTAKSESITVTSVLAANSTKELVSLFATCPISVEHWEGEDVSKEQIIKYNYPTKSSNISTFTIKDGEANQKVFSMTTRGVSGTNQYSSDLTKFFKQTCQSVFSSDEITCKKDYAPWDAGDKTKMIDLVVEAFKDNNIDPYLDRTRGGVEPASFSKKRSTLQQVCIGPRIEGIHAPGETLYLDTVPPVVRTTLYVMKNLKKIA